MNKHYEKVTIKIVTLENCDVILASLQASDGETFGVDRSWNFSPWGNGGTNE